LQASNDKKKKDNIQRPADVILNVEFEWGDDGVSTKNKRKRKVNAGNERGDKTTNNHSENNKNITSKLTDNSKEKSIGKMNC